MSEGGENLAIDFFERNIARTAQGGPPILGLQLLMGEKSAADDAERFGRHEARNFRAGGNRGGEEIACEASL